ncbi:MAG: hypothetical protein OXC56_08355, partial [Chloroflexi bacterium]|nr:hypothetical protein [Chloroflexota bacterium]
QALVAAITAGLRTSFVPSVVHQLADIEGFLDAVWPQLAPSVDTAGFLGSALYMADMALGAVEEVYDEPTLSRESLLAGGLSEADLDRVIAVLDVFHWLQPQLLLLLAALAEAHDAPSVGGQGRPEPREPSEREQAHIDTPVELASPQAGLLPEVPVELQLDAPPDLYRAIAVWPGYFDAVWDELQHLVAYPLFRQRGRALYFYARSSSRFLAVPLLADDAAMREAGMRPEDIARARTIVDRELSAVSTMMMHCTAMRLGLGLREREVVREA